MRSATVTILCAMLVCPPACAIGVEDQNGFMGGGAPLPGDDGGEDTGTSTGAGVTDDDATGGGGGTEGGTGDETTWAGDDTGTTATDGSPTDDGGMTSSTGEPADPPPQEDPGYPRPESTSCPAGFVLLYVLDGGVLCTKECPDDGDATCPPGATGNADPWCSFPSETASDTDCTMTGTCTDPAESCIPFADSSHCRDGRSRCGLWCGANERTCPDGMTCAGGFCGY